MRRIILVNAGRHDEAMRYPLETLSEHRWQPTSPLDCAERSCGDPAGTQRRCKHPASSHRVLHGEVDSHTADG